jgi:hypothetical protein
MYDKVSGFDADVNPIDHGKRVGMYLWQQTPYD